MNSDKNSAILEKQLKTLGQKIRIDILKALSASSNPLSFSSLQKELFYTSKNLTNFSFHLKSLKNINLITSFADGWVLTSLGKKIIEQIISIEQVIEEQEKTLMIRTSKYSKEPFNVQKIQSYLVIEGGMEIADANNIAKEV
ncbi:MAG: ArsR/SmtB family transcription factor, partial [Promethearchaeota archaeon]